MSAMDELLSFSQLNSYARCAEQYRLERVVRVPQRPSWALVGGSAAHAVTERRDLLAHGQEPDGSLDFEEEFWAEATATEERSGFPQAEFRASGRASKQWPNKEDPEWWLYHGPQMVDRWTQYMTRLPHPLWVDPKGNPGIEVPFEYRIGGADLVVRGFIDRVFDLGDGNLVVVDIKTGSAKQPSLRQLGVYRVAMEAKFPDHRVVAGTFWDARTGADSGFQSLDDHTADRLAYQMRALSLARRENLYIASPSNMCVSCSVRDFCYEITPDATTKVRPPWVSPDEWGAPDFVGDVA